MKLTATQLRQIIKEEVQKTLRTQTSRKKSLHEAPDSKPESYILIPKQHAEYMGISPVDFNSLVTGLGSKYPSVKFVSGRRDAVTATGSRAELESLALELDEELMGGAQSIDDEDSLVNAIQDFSKKRY